MMQSLRHLYLVVAVGFVAGAPLYGFEVNVIVNPSSAAASTTMAELKAVFLEKKTSLSDGSRVQPVLLTRSPGYQDFSEHILGKTTSSLETYYRSMVFSGTGMLPKMLASDDQVVAYVAKTKGAIGYVSASANVTGVKVLKVK